MNADGYRRAWRRVGPLAAIVCAFAAFAPAFGQVHWTNNEDAGISRAQKEDRLLILFFNFDERMHRKSEHNGPDRNRNKVHDVFDEPEISALANKAFVPIRANFKANGEIMQKLGKKITRNDVVIATPDLRFLAKVDSGGNMTSANIQAAMEKSLNQWRSEVYAKKVRPTLQDPDATPTKLKSAIATLRNIGVDESDQDLIALLGREKLDPGVRVLAFDALADLSTENAVRELVKQAATYPPAVKSLSKCPARALPTLASYLNGDPTPEFLLAYRTIAGITHTSKKPDEFWTKADAAERESEANRMKEIAAKKTGG